tara:strand:+ start:131 stop:436 length:306 start_codon:yes stop_codon:yes gene_type:complete
MDMQSLLASAIPSVAAATVIGLGASTYDSAKSITSLEVKQDNYEEWHERNIQAQDMLITDIRTLTTRVDVLIPIVEEKNAKLDKQFALLEQRVEFMNDRQK